MGLDRRTFEITAEIPARYEPDGKGSRIKVPARAVTEWVEVVVDWNWLARQMGERAVLNRIRKASEMAGAVTAKVVKVSDRATKKGQKEPKP